MTVTVWGWNVSSGSGFWFQWFLREGGIGGPCENGTICPSVFFRPVSQSFLSDLGHRNSFMHVQGGVVRLCFHTFDTGMVPVLVCMVPGTSGSDGSRENLLNGGSQMGA